MAAILESGWQDRLDAEFREDYMGELRSFLVQEKKESKIIYPRTPAVFAAFQLTPWEAVKVVILGQDPYHGVGQAQGLCFSVPDEMRLPPSLVNIYKELYSDLGIPLSKKGCLIPWAKQGVLLLNSVLTVEQGRAGSHQGKGWEQFTDRVITLLNAQKEELVFLLWGAYAQKKGQLIDEKRHCILKAAHPSPFSAHQGFLGCRHFSKANSYFISVGKEPIDWRLD